jgi:hypothetical protein
LLFGTEFSLEILYLSMILLVDSLFDTGVRYCNIQGEGERDTADRGDTILKKGGKMGEKGGTGGRSWDECFSAVQTQE